METLGEHAKNNGVKLIYEPLNRYETNLFNLFCDASAFLENLSTNGVTLLADLFHMSIEESNIADSIEKGSRHLGHVHFADSNRKPVGNGHTNIEPIASALKKINYNGCISAEAFAWPDSISAAKTTINSYKKVLFIIHYPFVFIFLMPTSKKTIEAPTTFKGIAKNIGPGMILSDQ